MFANWNEAGFDQSADLSVFEQKLSEARFHYQGNALTKFDKISYTAHLSLPGKSQECKKIMRLIFKN